MESQKISQTQIICIGACNVMGTIIVSIFATSVLHHEAWLAAILGFVAHLPAIFIYCALAKKYPGKGLWQINEAVFGPIAGRLLSIIYLLFFFSSCTLSIHEAANFLSYFILSNTSYLAIASLIVAGCVYGAKKGIMPLARVSTIFLIMMGVVMLFNGAITLIDAKFEYLLPLFLHKPLDYVQEMHISASLPYGESIALLVFIPDLHKKVSIKKTFFMVAIFTAVIMAFIHIREAIALGPLVAFLSLPTYEAARLIHVPGVLTRIESLFALALIMLTFFKTLILFYICNDGIKHVTRIASSRHITVMLGVLLAAYTVTTNASSMTLIVLGKNVSPFIMSFFVLLLPLLTLAAAAVRNLRIRRKSSAKGATQ